MTERAYPKPHVKLLYSKSAGRCNFPACPNLCVEEDLATGEIYNSGEIAHIEGVAPKSLRHNPKLEKKQRDAYNNWILLCRNHHPIIDIDSQVIEDVYSIETLRNWKLDLEKRVFSSIENAMPSVTSLELDFLTNLLLSKADIPTNEFSLLSPEEKLKKNGLTEYVKRLLETGLGKAREVEEYITHLEKISFGFAERLRATFIEEYRNLIQKNFEGDALFVALWNFACKNSSVSTQRAAGLAILVYFFEKCEVFKK